jgi:hypothetical protein
MSRSFPFLVCLAIGVLLSATWLCAQSTSPPLVEARPGTAESLVVLRNGQVLRGQVTSDRDRFLVKLPGREISVRRNEVDVVSRSLDDAYQLKRAKVSPSDVVGRLDLAEWCLEQGLLGNAGAELAVVLSLEPDSRRLAALDRRLRRMLTAATEPQNSIATTVSSSASGPQRASWPPPSAAPPVGTLRKTTKPADTRSKGAASSMESPAALERFVRMLPSGSVEQFTNNVQPMIVHSCATSGCHSPGDKSGFTLLRLPIGKPASRRLTQRNLHNTVQLVDFSEPGESRLLKIASKPHGPLRSGVFGDQRSPKYRELVEWVAEVTSSKNSEMDEQAEMGIAAATEHVLPPASVSVEHSGNVRSRASLSHAGVSPGRPLAPEHFPGSVQRASFEEPAPRRAQAPAHAHQSVSDQPPLHNQIHLQTGGTNASVQRPQSVQRQVAGNEHDAPLAARRVVEQQRPRPMDSGAPGLQSPLQQTLSRYRETMKK